MRGSGNKGGRQRGHNSSKTQDEKHHHCGGRPALFITGTGPGSREHISERAIRAIKAADVVCGYSTYVDLIRPLIAEGSEIISTGMTREVERVRQAVETVLSGRTCALVCSGDPGIYAMAGLVFQFCRDNGIRLGIGEGCMQVEVVPGISALSAGAALLGAPLMHDFCAVSLSDLLTPWEVIEKRLHAAGSADFVTVLYNPKSRKRTWQLGAARDILLQYRDPETPAGLVTSAMRRDQNIGFTTLRDLDPGHAGMQTTVFVGNSTTFVYGNHMVTPRGYEGKYKIQIQESEKDPDTETCGENS